MKRKPYKRTPVLIAFGVVLLVCVLRWLSFEFPERFECATYDLRARVALKFPAPCATNLGFAYLDDHTVTAVRDGRLGYRFGLHWPRQVYGRVVSELAAQGAHSIAFDVLYGELRPDHPPVQMKDGSLVESDQFFADQLAAASNVLIATTEDLQPPQLFLTNAAAAGDISTFQDPDGVLRRARAFQTYRRWHPLFLAVADDPDYGVDLRHARLEPGRIILPQSSGESITIPLASDGTFAAADFIGDKLPPGVPERARPFAEQRVWHMGLMLAARQLAADLDGAEVDLHKGSIAFGEGGSRRVIPVDRNGFFYIDWCMPPDHPALAREPIDALLAQNRARLQGEPVGDNGAWGGKSVVIGSAASGNDLTDRGSTPLAADTLLVSKHWNVANSILTGRFVRRAPIGLELFIIAVLGLLVAAVTWRAPALAASGSVLGLMCGYVLLAFGVYIQSRYWLPIVFPVMGAMLVMYVSLTVWLVLFEQADKRRVRSIFSTIVSPKIVNELLASETLPLGGARREITVLFADVRGFTEFIERGQEQVRARVHQDNLTGGEAKKRFDDRARDDLNTVNLYLGLVADIIIQHDGTLDKYIGDCVMAFWGAPTSNPRHAVSCLRAAIEAQRAIRRLNEQRTRENTARSQPGQPPLPILELGTGINTGIATVGLMGSEAKTRNYTVFGRDVNLASRLESQSGSSHIYIAYGTYEHLVRDDPQLARSCVSLPPLTVKGFREPVAVYEVPWQTPDPDLPPSSGPALVSESAL